MPAKFLRFSLSTETEARSFIAAVRIGWNQMRLIFALALLAVLSACGTDPIIMREPKTGDCGSRREVGAWDVAANPQREEACVRDISCAAG
jgi:hypothetical protein